MKKRYIFLTLLSPLVLAGCTHAITNDNQQSSNSEVVGMQGDNHMQNNNQDNMQELEVDIQASKVQWMGE